MNSVGDADNFRFYHTPAFGWRWPFKFRRVPTATKGAIGCLLPQCSLDCIFVALKDNTLHIRIGGDRGVDAPEVLSPFTRPFFVLVSLCGT